MQTCTKSRFYPLFAILIGFALLACLGMNPFFLPDFYDDITYYLLGKSLAEQGVYQMMGQYVIDWPPLLPLLLAGFFILFGASVILVKLLMISFALTGIALAFFLCRQEDRPYPLLNTLLIALFPTSLAMATRISSEWLYILLSFAFLLILNFLQHRRSLAWGMMGGVILGLAMLTRYIGVTLGAAWLAHVWILYRKKGFRFLIPELVLAGMASGMILLWFLWVEIHLKGSGTLVQTSNYHEYGLTLWSEFEPGRLALTLSDLFFQSENLMEIFPFFTVLIEGVSWALLGILVIGFIYQSRQTHLKPSDAYALAMLAILVLYHWKISRYLLPLSPFLLSYFFQGCHVLSRWGSAARVYYKQIAIIGWCLALFGMDLIFLFAGNGRTHQGLSFLVSRDGNTFYRGVWRELYALSRPLQTAPRGSVVGLKGEVSSYWIYLHGFSGLRTINSDLVEDPTDFLIIQNGDPPPPYPLLLQEEHYSLYACPSRL